VSDPAAKDALSQARVRINALALVHRILYEIEDQQSVDVKNLLELLAEQTNEGFGGDRRNIRTSVNAISWRVSGDSAVPIALFTVEALTNSYRHAYPAGRGGTIRVLFTRTGDGRLRLSVEDDGAGFASESEGPSVGVQLIRTFAQQLGGNVSVHSSAEYGTVADLVFPVPNSAH
jgi:two-component sensor histidine kinase